MNNKNEDLKLVNNNQSYEKSNTLRIARKDLNQMNDFINFQNYYNVLKKYKDYNFILNEDTIENLTNANNLYPHQKNSSSYVKLRKELKKLCTHVYSDSINKDITNKKNFKENFNYILNSVKPFNLKSKTRNKKIFKLNRYQIKSYFRPNKENTINENFCFRKKTPKYNKSESNEININNSKNEKRRIKFEYENYALNNTYFNHPQIYILTNNNNSSNLNEKLPPIDNLNSKKFYFKKSADLSTFIPYNTKQLKMRNNFYNYYIGMKLSKEKFN